MTNIGHFGDARAKPGTFVGRRGGGETHHGVGNDVLGHIRSGLAEGEAATHGGVGSDEAFGADDCDASVDRVELLRVQIFVTHHPVRSHNFCRFRENARERARVKQPNRFRPAQSRPRGRRAPIPAPRVAGFASAGPAPSAACKGK